MFKNTLIYRITPGWTMDAEAMESALAKTTFRPCGATQIWGWIVK